MQKNGFGHLISILYQSFFRMKIVLYSFAFCVCSTFKLCLVEVGKGRQVPQAKFSYNKLKKDSETNFPFQGRRFSPFLVTLS